MRLSGLIAPGIIALFLLACSPGAVRSTDGTGATTDGSTGDSGTPTTGGTDLGFTTGGESTGGTATGGTTTGGATTGGEDTTGGATTGGATGTDTTGTETGTTGGADTTTGGGTTGGGTTGGGTTGGGTTGGGTTGGGSEGIAALLELPDGPSTHGISGVVTYYRPPVGDDLGGFFVQEGPAGPAIFVGVDAAAAVPGAEVSLTVTELATDDKLRIAAAITDFELLSSGNDLAGWVQDVGASADLVSDLDSYTAELVTADLEIWGVADFAGEGHTAFPVRTDGNPDGMHTKLRMTDTVLAGLPDTSAGCRYRVGPTPLWRHQATAQFSAWAADELEFLGCAAPYVVSATATDPTHVRVTFSRPLSAASIKSEGSQFTFTGGLASFAAKVDGPDRVLVTTAKQNAGMQYTVAAAETVKDVDGQAVSLAANTATFKGYIPVAVLRINEINAHISSGCDLLELRAAVGGSLDGYVLRERVTTVADFSGLTVEAGDFIVVHFRTDTCNNSGSPSETTAKNQAPASAHPQNYDGAYDIWVDDTGLTDTTNTLSVRSNLSELQDVVLLADGVCCSAAKDSETAAAQGVAEGQWTNIDGSVPAGGYVDDTFHASAVTDLDGTSTEPTGTSTQRTSLTDQNHKGDWTDSFQSTFGAPNPGQ